MKRYLETVNQWISDETCRRQRLVSTSAHACQLLQSEAGKRAARKLFQGEPKACAGGELPSHLLSPELLAERVGCAKQLVAGLASKPMLALTLFIASSSNSPK